MKSKLRHNLMQLSVFSPKLHDELTYEEKKHKLLYSLAHFYFIAHNKSLPPGNTKSGISAQKRLQRESWKHANEQFDKNKNLFDKEINETKARI